MNYFPEPYTRSENKITVELDLFNQVTEFDLKRTTGIDTSKFVKKVDLTGLKSEIDKLDINAIGTTPVDFSKVSDAVKI